ncbi:CopG family transcriptional regulator [Acaryochloris sp. CCMEE 5410]|uniref:CopG family transcriptional regulator n=1 Tax=Acaryochloris sp. CCMEE 5410 TaxID=310037 RepID=UPI0002483804|nr:CopG family transcriptional regulator [Acaryochloris sp. CCMEE 5410]KAI9129291.1 CopG family transcriptional regulator [Acaryochloris sp. CCMEE 5410]
MNKTRKTLDDSLAQAFVFGENTSTTDIDLDVPQENIDPDTVNEAISQRKNIVDKFQDEPKERTIRFTADLPESLHKKLSMLAARTGKKKVDIVRLLLAEALEDID